MKRLLQATLLDPLFLGFITGVALFKIFAFLFPLGI